MKPTIIETTKSITVKGIVDEDFVNYRVPSMTIMFPYCTFKCGYDLCQNSSLTSDKNIEVPIKNIYERYISNPISEAIVCQGLEPFVSWEELNELLFYIRMQERCHDDFVIYTGYDKKEIARKVDYLQKMYSNIVIKFGRYIPNQQPHYDPILGVMLASDNQYAERVS